MFSSMSFRRAAIFLGLMATVVLANPVPVPNPRTNTCSAPNTVPYEVADRDVLGVIADSQCPGSTCSAATLAGNSGIADVDQIWRGDTVCLPAFPSNLQTCDTATSSYYYTQSGDTLTTIAANRPPLTAQTIYQANQRVMTSPDSLATGIVL
ncbi:MAG: hypothetical protein M1838_004040 [Thelocarpon superellum]|nr:MAG: hypothetical protein M1838_004040 [Thelocarpon superellum]